MAATFKPTLYAVLVVLLFTFLSAQDMNEERIKKENTKRQETGYNDEQSDGINQSNSQRDDGISDILEDVLPKENTLKRRSRIN